MILVLLFGMFGIRPWRFRPSPVAWMPAYANNDMARAAIERKFEIIGEAPNQLSKLDTALVIRIPDLPQIVAFRNQLIHGYATVSSHTVWYVVQNALPPFLVAVQSLLDELV